MELLGFDKKGIVGVLMMASMLIPNVQEQLGLTDILNNTFAFLGTGPGGGFDFILTFILTFTVLWLSISLIPKFTEDNTRNAALMFASVAAVSAAVYVFINKIPFLQTIAPFALILIVILFIVAMVRLMTIGSGRATLWSAAIVAIIIGLMITIYFPIYAAWGVWVYWIGFGLLIAAIGKRILG